MRTVIKISSHHRKQQQQTRKKSTIDIVFRRHDRSTDVLFGLDCAIVICLLMSDLRRDWVRFAAAQRCIAANLLLSFCVFWWSNVCVSAWISECVSAHCESDSNAWWSLETNQRPLTLPPSYRTLFNVYVTISPLCYFYHRFPTPCIGVNTNYREIKTSFKNERCFSIRFVLRCFLTGAAFAFCACRRVMRDNRSR